MSTRKEEERNEKIIRGLMKLPPNRKCINCNSLGPQYVCTNFWTFICITCSGIHREFTHRVKSVSMAKFTIQEVDALQRGGNQRAREIFLRDWDMQRQRLPISSNPDKIREFIKNVYVERKYAGGKSSDKPPRDTQSHKNHEEDHRRASSYHSFSQSPPYEYQYEDRRYGKQTGILSRKPGSDRGHSEGNISSFVCSPGRMSDHMYDDRFANEVSANRVSVSSTGNPFSLDSQSPDFQRGSGYSSPPVSDILVEDVHHQANAKRDVSGITHPQKSVSSGSLGSLDNNSISLASVNSSSLLDILESGGSSGTQQTGTCPFPFLPQTSGFASAASQDFFGPSFVQPTETFSAPTMDLFADMTQQNTTTSAPQTTNEGWATFDLPNQPTSAPQTKPEAPTIMSPGNTSTMGNLGTLSSPWNAFDDSTGKLPRASLGSLLQNGEPPVPAQQYNNSSELWNAFHDSTGNFPQASLQNLLQESKPLVPTHNPPTSGDIHLFKNSEPWNAFDESTGKLPQASFENLPQNFEPVPPQNPSASGDHHQYKNSSEPWNAFDGSTGSPLQASFVNFQPKSEPLVPAQKPPTSGDHHQYKNSLDDFSKNAFQYPTPTLPLGGVMTGSSFPPPVLPLKGGEFSHIHDKKSSNPFDLPYDSDFEPGNTFLDMSSLQTALPNPPLPTTYVDGSMTEPWFPQSSVSPYISSTSNGGLAYMAAQAPSSQLPSLPSQGPVASVGGNPFA
ncbi:hypothetical protein MRB53_009485 [Persea americana]|uniref:Uncharacterized protein n=1 Tax=Persea americana TaxID=3435 RepID=A0ACC2LPX0_PERAE|nr:hypothetical protein MRB53_009485 [Persea americana]